ncbi:hypothetical protein [Bradyrhizobium genosp. P]|uniref:hypothetical protein n=1 Tax=Bradyrhizobium genosp. P TaxID=83641 RepID=UPI003CF3BFA2
MSFLKKLQEAGEQHNSPPPDPWRKIIANAVNGVEAMSTAALLDLVGARRTTSNARRVASIMRDLKFIPIQSRRLVPGGFLDTVTRGWARPLRAGAQDRGLATRGHQNGTT